MSVASHHSFVKMELVEKSSNYSTKNFKLNYITNEEHKFCPSVEESLKNVIAKEGFTSHEISQRIIRTDGNSYMGDLYEVDIKGKTEKGPKEINVFLKITNVGLSLLCNIKLCYSHEIWFYTELSHIFNTLQESFNIPQGERLKMVKSYECVSDAIILENISRKGFKTLFRMDVIPLKFAELSITQLAKLHGLSFAMKHKRRDYFETNIKTIESSLLFDEIVVWKKIAKNMFEISTSHFNRDTQEKIEYFLQKNFYEKFPKYSIGDTNSVKCMCHGDFRNSNLMVKESDIEETEVVLIDYQFLFYGSPVMDLLYFFYTGTNRKFRKAHMKYLKDLYHSKLTEFLKYFDIDINDVYPKKVYEKDFEDSLDFGLMVALYVSPIVIFSVKDENSDSGKDTGDDMTYKVDDRLKERITEVVEEYMEWGILK